MNTLVNHSPFVKFVEKIFAQQNLGSDQHRRQALDLFLANGLPSTKSEEYRYTPISRLLDERVLPEGKTTLDPAKVLSLQLVNDMPCNLVVFVNGEYSSGHSIILDKSIEVSLTNAPLSSANQDPFDLLNRAFNNQEVRIRVAEKQSVEHPLAVVYYFDSPSFVFANPRWACQVSSQSKLVLLEYTIATESSSYFNNKHSRVEVGEGANLEFIALQNGASDEIQMNNSWINLSSSAKATCFTFTARGKLVRNNLTLNLNGEGIDARLNGLYLASGNSLIDNHTVVDHRKPRSYSNELYKGVIGGNAKGVFNGKIFVRMDAQKTNAFQSNRNILLSESAAVHTKPQLEIWADDVKCSHGCTTGQLDEEALFYLRSRGLSRDIAKGMLLYAFAAETLDGIKHEAIRNFVDKQISENIHRTT